MSKRKNNDGEEPTTKKPRNNDFGASHLAKKMSNQELAKLRDICTCRVGNKNALAEAEFVWQQCRNLTKIAKMESKRQKDGKPFTITALGVMQQLLVQNACDKKNPNLNFDFVDHPVRGSTQRMMLQIVDATIGKVNDNFILVCRQPIALTGEKELELRDLLRQNYQLETEEQITEYVKILRQFVGSRVAGMKHSTKERNERGRAHANSEIDEKYALEQFIQQRGRCHYLHHVILRFIKGKTNEDLMSSERVDNTIGYVKGNFAWCCIQLNGRIQFTKLIHDQFLLAASKNLTVPEETLNSVRTAIVTPPRPTGPTNKQRNVMPDGTWLCNCCKWYQPPEAFVFRTGRLVPIQNCKRCSNEILKERRKSDVRGFFLGLITSCDSHNKRRKAEFERENERRTKKGNELLVAHPNAFDNDLTLEWFVEQCLHTQGAKCRVANYPMVALPGCFNSISPERLNEDIGYTKENCVLICAFFQNGHCQWDREMFLRDFSPTCAKKKQ